MHFVKLYGCWMFLWFVPPVSYSRPLWEECLDLRERGLIVNLKPVHVKCNVSSMADCHRMCQGRTCDSYTYFKPGGFCRLYTSGGKGLTVFSVESDLDVTTVLLNKECFGGSNLIRNKRDGMMTYAPMVAAPTCTGPNCMVPSATTTTTAPCVGPGCGGAQTTTPCTGPECQSMVYACTGDGCATTMATPCVGPGCDGGQTATPCTGPGCQSMVYACTGDGCATTAGSGAAMTYGTFAPAAGATYMTAAPGAGMTYGTFAPAAGATYMTAAPEAGMTYGTFAPAAGATYMTAAPGAGMTYGTFAPTTASTLGAATPAVTVITVTDAGFTDVGYTDSTATDIIDMAAGGTTMITYDAETTTAGTQPTDQGATSGTDIIDMGGNTDVTDSTLTPDQGSSSAPIDTGAQTMPTYVVTGGTDQTAGSDTMPTDTAPTDSIASDTVATDTMATDSGATDTTAPGPITYPVPDTSSQTPAPLTYATGAITAATDSPVVVVTDTSVVTGAATDQPFTVVGTIPTIEGGTTTCTPGNVSSLQVSTHAPSVWLEWGPWGTCSKMCGTGMSVRNRVCSQPAGCEGCMTEMKICNPQSCCSDWSDWSPCSVTCGQGTQLRHQRCIVEGKNMPTGYATKEITVTQCCTGAKMTCSVWSKWSSWGACTVSCAGGTKIRTRRCEPTPGDCTGPDSEPTNCNGQACPVWSEWGPWSACSHTCGSGITIRSRTCSDGQNCPGESRQTQNCNPVACPFWSAWSTWGHCSRSCNGGETTRTRVCINDQKYCQGVNATSPNCMCPIGPDNVGNATTKACNQFACPTVSNWGDWSACSQPCGGGQQTRTRPCQVDETYCTPSHMNERVCMCQESTNETRVCNTQTCATQGPWTPWSTCSATCGGGSQTRTRPCNVDKTVCVGDMVDSPSCKCDGQTTETQNCNAFTCPSIGNWQPWSPCSKPCGGGQQTRTRPCNVDLNYCTPDKMKTDKVCMCTEPGTESRTCNTQTCAGLTPWSTWGDCSATCGNGTTTRTRVCNTDKTVCVGDMLTNPACQCSGETTNVQTCNQYSCPVIGNWGDWSTCSRPCGGGQQTRTRPCIVDKSYCTEDKMLIDKVCMCVETTNATQPCNTQTCATWAPWGEWTECSVSCGNGTSTRSRVCNTDQKVCVGDMVNSPACKCEGSDTDTQSCDKGECYTWSSWSKWSECTVVCGGGSRNRSRTCPIEGSCPGLNELSDICNMIPCPDWGEWSLWSDCTVSCGGGERSRIRACPIPNGCSPGEEYEFDPQHCNPEVCPTWSDWTEWSKCSRSCGQGNRQRTRKCTPVSDGCLGSGDNVEPCFLTACTLSTEWSQWSPCTQTCGGGMRTRSRVKCPSGPPKCPIEQNTSRCNEQACPLWSDWSQWGSCSKTCGGGQRLRSRTCPVVNGCLGQNSEIDAVPCNNFGCKH